MVAQNYIHTPPVTQLEIYTHDNVIKAPASEHLVRTDTHEETLQKRFSMREKINVPKLLNERRVTQGEGESHQQ